MAKGDANLTEARWPPETCRLSDLGVLESHRWVPGGVLNRKPTSRDLGQTANPQQRWAKWLRLPSCQDDFFTSLERHEGEDVVHYDVCLDIWQNQTELKQPNPKFSSPGSGFPGQTTSLSKGLGALPTYPWAAVSVSCQFPWGPGSSTSSWYYRACLPLPLCVHCVPKWPTTCFSVSSPRPWGPGTNKLLLITSVPLLSAVFSHHYNGE